MKIKIVSIIASSMLLFVGSTRAADVFGDFSKALKVTQPVAISPEKLGKEVLQSLPQSSANPLEELRKNKELVLSELMMHDIFIRSYVVEADGKLTYLVANVAAKGKKVVVQQDYVNFKTVKVDGKDTRVGITLRVQAELITKSANVDLGGLFAIGLAVKAGSAAGTMRVQVYGMTGQSVSTILPMPSEISEASLQSAMQAVATLKAKLYDKDVLVMPMELPEV